MTDKINYYKVLGLENNASAGEIRKAFRKLSKTHHPDKGGDPEMFKNIAAAYEVLSDSEKKAEHDKELKTPAGGTPQWMEDKLKRHEEKMAAQEEEERQRMYEAMARREMEDQAEAVEAAKREEEDAEAKRRDEQMLEKVNRRLEALSQRSQTRGQKARSASAAVEAVAAKRESSEPQLVSAYDYTKVGPAAEHVKAWREANPLSQPEKQKPVAQSSAGGGDKKRKSKKFKSKKFKSKKKKSKRKSKRSSKKRKTRRR
jgi:curved DNA-binding protein CbpA